MPRLRRHFHPAWLPLSVRIRCSNPKTDVSVLRGEGPMQITDGVGGWDVVNRPRQVGMTQWSGVEPFQVKIPVQFEGWKPTAAQWGSPDGVDMNPGIYALLRCARGTDEHPPGICRVYGLVLPAERWVIENIEFGDNTIVTLGGGKTLRQDATITLREYVPPSYLRVSKRALDSPKGRTKTYVVKRTARKGASKRTGQTPAEIAKVLRCKWTDLRQLNPKVVKKAGQHLKIGVKLRVPVSATRPRKAHSKRQAATKKHRR
jgi:hypothetical protein